MNELRVMFNGCCVVDRQEDFIFRETIESLLYRSLYRSLDQLPVLESIYYFYHGHISDNECVLTPVDIFLMCFLLGFLLLA